jgi:uncharacterized protein (TIGR02996 family)
MLISPAELGFFRQIRRQPDLTGPRLVYADYLDERGDVERAEFVRLGCWKSGLKVRAPGHELTERAAQLLDAHLYDWHLPLTDPARSEAVEVRSSRPGRVQVIVRRGGRRLWAVLDYDRGMVARARFYAVAAYRLLAPEVIQCAPCADFGLMDSGDGGTLARLDQVHFPEHVLGPALFGLVAGHGDHYPPWAVKRFDPPHAGPRARKVLERAMTIAAWKVLTGELEAL